MLIAQTQGHKKKVKQFIFFLKAAEEGWEKKIVWKQTETIDGRK